MAFLATWLFDASVDAQGGAYATGVLVLISSAAVAVTLSARHKGQHRRTVGFGAIAAARTSTSAETAPTRRRGGRAGPGPV